MGFPAFIGTWGTLLLPINADESIDYGRLGTELDYMIEAKLEGIYSNGTACEFHNQTEDEFDKIQEILAGKCKLAGMKFQVGCNHVNPTVTLERVKRVVGLKPDGIQVILPDWVSLTAAEQEHYLDLIADTAGDIPIVLYNPPHSKLLLQPADFERLADRIPKLVGIKVAGGDGAWYNAMRSLRNRLSIFVPGHFLATGIKQQVAAGSYSNVACINPKAAQAWWQMMQVDISMALELQERILQFFDQVITPFKNDGYSNPALDKFLAAVGGWSPIGTRLRWPYKWIPEKEVLRARTIAIKALPEFFNTDEV